MGACGSQFPFNRKARDANNEDESGDAKGEENGHHSHRAVTETQYNVKRQSNRYSNITSSFSSFDKPNSLKSFTSANFDAEKLLSIYDLYNILNDSGIRPYIHDPLNFLLVDSRDVDSYTASHVITAKQHSTLMNNAKCQEVLTKYVVIVIYGNEIRNDADSQDLVELMQRIEEYVASDILILKDGFTNFSRKFPYLCTERDIESVADRKLLLCHPSVIIDECLYQGRGDQATNEKIINTLGITHIVNISEHKNAFPKQIKYLKLPLDDMVTTNLSQHFHKTSVFIKDALADNGCVLVHCNLGVSRSSTVTLAYLMRSKNWKLGYAYRFLKARRTCSSPNSGFLRQLSEWECELFGEKYTNIDTLKG